MLDDAVELDGELKEWSEVSQAVSGQIRVELPVSRWAIGSHVVYRNLEALIGRCLFLTHAPTACYLVDEDVLLPQDEATGQVAGYLRAVDLADLLSQQADHMECSGGKPQLIFLHKASLKLPLDYEVRDLANPAQGLEQLTELLGSSEHKEQKKSIFKAVLYDRLANESEPEQRFRRLLRNLPGFLTEFRERYQLFVCEFDFEEVRKELEEKRRDYLVRLNATFHDLGAKLLSVPVAFYLGVTKMIPLPTNGGVFEALLLNAVVTLAVLIVGLYIWMLLNSHCHTLLATAQEYSALLGRWHEKLSFQEQRAEVDEVRESLDQSKKRLLTYFSVIRWSVIITVAITIALFLMRIFRWENSVWNALYALKTALLP